MDTLDLSHFCKTKAEATEFMMKLDRISEQIYKNGFSLEKVLLEELGIQKKDKFLILLRNNTITSESQTQLKTFLQKIRETVAALPVLSLTLAFEPKEETLETFSQWFLLNIKKQFLFDVKVDKTLIAGAAISVNGKFGDYSVKDAVTKTITDVLTQTAQPKEETTKHQDPNHMHMGR